MLDAKVTKRITDFVKTKPRTVQEVSHLIKKNWRTADRYVDKISRDTGSIAVRTFRGGTQGALKVVYWQALENIHSSDLQQKLFRMIEHSRSKYEFSPLEIYQYIDPKKKHAFFEEQSDDQVMIEHELLGHLESAQKQVLFFSGNLSFAHVVEVNKKLVDVLEELARNNIPVKFLANIDMAAVKNLHKLLAVNEKVGKEMIEIKHAVHPLRSFIVDNRFARFKETRKPSRFDTPGKKTCIFYEIYDQDWIEWMQKVFWNMFRTGVPAQKRLENIEAIQKLVR